MSRPLNPPEDTAEQSADAGPGADASGLAADPFALDGLGHSGPDRIAAPADRDLVETQRQAPRAIEPAGTVHRTNDAAEHRAGGDENPLGVVEVEHGRCLEAVLDLGRAGAELGLEPHVNLRPYRQVVSPSVRMLRMSSGGQTPRDRPT
ncbi:MAG TPA: hypothetical protein VMO26_18660 [Vicinamibacterales bacterium]|nr:hypothetical protein [Vicinamibacterales bacterium]